MDPTAARFVTAAQLHANQAPTSLLAAAALQSSDAAGVDLGKADYIVLAVPGGTAGDAVDRIKAALPPDAPADA